MDGQPLKPLSHGNILIVGAKPSNFGQEILTHPRVIIWNSQQEHWTDKDLPSNIQAVFVTRWVSHSAFGKILSEARKRHITMFNPEGTGMIAKQVKELLSMNNKETVIMTPQTTPIQTVPQKAIGFNSKLHVLLPYVDWSKSNIDNAKEMMKMLDHHGITSTHQSLANFVGQQRKKLFPEVTAHRKPVKVVRVHKGKADTGLDVAVQMLDDAISQLRDMRAFLVATTEENTKLRARLDMFKKALEE